MKLSYSDTISILELFDTVEDCEKVQEILDEIEDDCGEIHEKIIWTKGERNGRIPPVTFDFLRALVNMFKFTLETQEMEGKR